MTGCLFALMLLVLWAGIMLALAHTLITSPFAIVATCILFALKMLR